MTWRKNPREITDEHFSDGTTVDGNRIDTAVGDVVENFNNISYGYLRKRWVPITYVAGWSPQSPTSIDVAGGGLPWVPAAPLPSTDPDDGKISPTHRWPWLRVRNFIDEVAKDTLGSVVGDDVTFSNPYRLKGVGVGGIDPFGGVTTTPGAAPGDPPEISSSNDPIGAQFAWTRSWFISPPSILDSIDLIFTIDSAVIEGAASPPVYSNRTLTTEDDDELDLARFALVLTAAVDSEFDREDRNMADVEVLRRAFDVSQDQISTFPLPASGAGAVGPPAITGYSDFDPEVQEYDGPASKGFVAATTTKGVHVKLTNLNIPLHQRSRLRVSIVIPRFDPYVEGAWEDLPWLMQKVDMAVTMLEEVTRG